LPVNFSQGKGLGDRHHRPANLADYLQPRDIPSESFRAGLVRPTVKSEWRRPGKVEVKHIPNLNIGQAQMHGNKLKKPV
jgi:hypothetical protein